MDTFSLRNAKSYNKKMGRGYLVALAFGPAAPVAFIVALVPAVVAFFAVPTPAGACAFATLTVYTAAVTNAVNNIAAIIMNDICFCIGYR